MFQLSFSNKNLIFLFPACRQIIMKKSRHASCCARWKWLRRMYCSSNCGENELMSVTKLNSPEFYSIFTPELKKLAAVFEKHGHELRIVGGAVRDLLNGERPHDLDFATSATPDQMKKMFESDQIRIVNNKGEKHGTITPRINNKENFEVTTLRTDVSTDGRHAHVEFTTDWKTDAARRDLTINSMYLGLDGKVYDYFHGYRDLKNKKVIFVGDVDARIKEDYLRILRYFRFFGRISKTGTDYDEPTLQAIQNNVSGLKRISGERIWSELSRILSGNFIEEIVKKMLQLGLGPFIGFSDVDKLDMKCFEKICRLHSDLTYRPISFIAALMPNEEKVMNFHDRVKLSADERDLAQLLVNHKSDAAFDPSENPLKPYQYLAVCKRIPEAHVIELMKFRGETKLSEKFVSQKIPIFPVNGKLLKSVGIHDKKEIGRIMYTMKKAWVTSDFQLNAEDLLRQYT